MTADEIAHRANEVDHHDTESLRDLLLALAERVARIEDAEEYESEVSRRQRGLPPEA
jgi:hypothetical protein